MRAATRFLPSTAQALRTSPALRFQIQPHAGPSRPSVQIRAASTTPLPPSFTSPTSPHPSSPIANATSDIEGEEIPSNLTFEGFEDEARDDIGRGLSYSGDRLHALPSGPLDPIILPLSSLASETPTLAARSGLAISLSRDVFGQPLRRDILHRCVVWYLSTLREGNQHTKNRSTVAYSGKKLRRQKGTGKARVGDASSGTRRGGAPIFALTNRDHALLLPRKIRDLGLKIALSSKLSSGLLRVVEDLDEAGWLGTNDAKKGLCDRFVDAEEVLRMEREVESGVEGEEVGVLVAGESADVEGASQVSSVAPEDGTSAPEAPVEASTSAAELETTTETPLQTTEQQQQPTTLQILQKFGPSTSLSILFLHSPFKHPTSIEKFTKKVRNMPGVFVMSTEEVQVWHLLKYRWVVMEGEAVEMIGGEEFGVGESEFEDGFAGEFEEGEEVRV